MGLMDLFVINNDKSKNEETKTQTTEAIKFPNSEQTGTPMATTQVYVPQATQVVAASPENPACQPHLDKIVQMYEDGFDKLNQAGYDFYEFYKAVVSGGLNNPQVYAMALSMGQAMDNKINKESLLTQSQFYIDEINKVHTHYVESGNSKKTEIIGIKEGERGQLVNELGGLKAQLEAISNQIIAKQGLLNDIDNKYAGDLTDIDCKIMANDVAKDRILSSITAVKMGLTNNLK